MSIPAEFWAKGPFDALDADERAEFEAACEIRTFDAGEVLYEAEKNAKGMYILIAGSLGLLDRIMATLNASGEVVVDEVGAVISRGSLLDSFPHRHECVAKTEIQVAFLARETLLAAFEDNRPYAFRLIDFMVQRGSDDVRALNQAIHGLLSEN